MKVYEGVNVPIKSWCNKPESGAITQAINLSKLPFVFKQVCLMPDTHKGYGMPIGGVIATKGAVIPNAVGVDIGCGMCAVRTSLKVEHLDAGTLKKIREEIRKAIPVGNGEGGSHKEAQDESLMPTKPFRNGNDYPMWLNNEGYRIVSREYNSALKQLGTLGGGNHFIEIQKGSDGHVWIMIHSGSRNLGYRVAKYYNNLAYDLNMKWHSNTYLPKNKEDSLAFLPIDTHEAKDYLKEMQYCVDFALASRKLMMSNVLKIVLNIIPDMKFNSSSKDNVEDAINIAHNYAKIENHFGQNVMVHRKGATLARENTIGIIPGSQGTSSYIVKGKGNRESFESCSHGAGRKMSRTEARKTLNLEEEIKNMNDKGIVHGLRIQNELDEAASAYKDIDVVMEEQKDLVNILVKLEPLGVIKG